MTQLDVSSSIAVRRARWRWFLVLGLSLLVLGIGGASLASLLQLTSLLVFGTLLLASSIFQLITALFAEERKERVLHSLAAVWELVLGFLVIAFPPQRIIGLIAVIAIFMVLTGLARLVRSLATRSRGRAWIVVSGVIAMLLGMSVWVGGSAGRLWFVGLCIAVDLICHGISWSAMGLTERVEPLTS